ncbi:MAG: hypothetical protein CVU61_03555 [Deltaproteobacteria bacterium HGW-Deltaproteobacteria-19]|jgi:hypothetical protein|nr:MAG: hypothetical protein CVU61_03555 [Deltaproteobacteria bacterium HGW-Deltaproteobacteria-19]
MLKVIEDEATIRRCQQQFSRSFRAVADARIPVRVGHAGASFRASVHWSDELDLWLYSKRIPEKNHWNVLGIGKPAPEGRVAITCEINFPIRGIDRKTGGALARDPEGSIFVVHRGRLGGSRKGIGKSLFGNRYRGVWALMEDGDEQAAVAVVGALHSPRFVRQLGQFVRKVQRMKDLAASRDPQMAIAFPEVEFREELSGEAALPVPDDLSRLCDRSLVAGDLAAALQSMGIQAGNDESRDCFAVDRQGRISILFKVLTSLRDGDVLEGAAKLLVDRVSFPEKPRLVLAVPADLPADLEESLKALGLEILPYAWDGEQAVFPDLKAIVRGIMTS